MYELNYSLFIDRSPEDIFNFITNPANSSKWQSAVDSAEWTSDSPVGVGSTWRSTAKFLGRKIVSTTEITHWNPPHSHSFKAVDGPIPFENTLKFEPNGNGTRVTIQGRAEIGGFFKLAEGLVGKQLDRQLESDFAALKLLMESGQA